MQFIATPSTVVSLATAEGAKMPLIPHIPELIFGLVMIGVLYWVVSTKVVPNLEKAYEERRAAIEGGGEAVEGEEITPGRDSRGCSSIRFGNRVQPLLPA